MTPPPVRRLDAVMLQAGVRAPGAVLADCMCPTQLGSGPDASLQADVTAMLAAAGAAFNFRVDPCGAASWCAWPGFC